MVEEQSRGNFIHLFGAHIRFLRLFGVSMPISEYCTTTNNINVNPLKRTLDFDDDDDEEDQENREVVKEHENNENDNSIPIYHPPEVIYNFIETTLRGKEIKTIIKKSCTKTDVDEHEARFSMPKNRILLESGFLTKEEEELIDKKKLNVLVIDPCLRSYELKLTKWKYPKKYKKENEGQDIDESQRGFSYMVTSGWNKFKKANASWLEESTMVQVLSFRDPNNKLGLAILKV